MATPDAARQPPPEESPAKRRQRTGSYSGRLLLRMPRTLHEELARAADRDGVSLNQFITGVLASAVDWKHEGAGTTPARGTRPQAMSLLLIVNLVLVGLAAAAAIGFLIAAWLS